MGLVYSLWYKNTTNVCICSLAFVSSSLFPFHCDRLRWVNHRVAMSPHSIINDNGVSQSQQVPGKYIEVPTNVITNDFSINSYVSYVDYTMYI